MALQWEIFDDMSEDDAAQLLQIGRQSKAREMTTTYTGVGDELAGQLLDGGVAEPGGLGAVAAGEPGAHHPLQP